MPRSMSVIEIHDMPIIDPSQSDRFSTVLDNFTSLKRLELKKNSLEVVQAEWFKNTKSLTALKITDNKINRIEEGTFDYLTGLRNLNLAEKNLTIVKVQWFQKTLAVLVLSNNLIDTIEAGAFSKLTKLSSLDLSGNRLWKLWELDCSETFKTP